MASELELRVSYRDRLFELLELEVVNKKKGNSVEGLDRLIAKTTAVMPQEDVKVVKQMISEHFDKG